MIGVVTGLRAEVRLLAGLGHPVIFAGRDPLAAARTLAEEGLSGLVSFGIAAALSPETRPGTLIIASEIITRHGRIATNAPWRNRVCRALPLAIQAAIASADRLPATRPQKAQLHAATAALAADSESHAVALVAAEFAIPFLAFRAVAHPVERDLAPRPATSAVTDPSLATPRRTDKAVGLLRNPIETAISLRLAYDMRKALAALHQGAGLIAG